MDAKLHAYKRVAAWYKVRDDGTICRMHLDEAFRPRFERCLEYGIEHHDASHYKRFNVSKDATQAEKLYQIMAEVSETYGMKMEWK